MAGHTQLVQSTGSLYIDGTWRQSASGETLDVVNPATLEVISTVPVATAGDLDAALVAAQSGLREWSAIDVFTRSAIIRRVGELMIERVDEIAETMTLEQGKPRAEAVGEVRASAEYFDWFADETRRHYGRMVDSHSKQTRILVTHQPIGVVAAFTAWNFPALLPARKIAAALAAGCSVILKPAEEAPLTALHLARACADAGVPAGVLNVVTGDPAFISSRLIESGVVRKVSLTGSIPVGRHILELCAKGIVSASMELGGHAPVLVLDDADVDQAVALTVKAKFRNTGQVCVSPSRFFVDKSVAEEFSEKFARLAGSLKIGAGIDPATEVGPLTNARRLEAVELMVADAVGKGAQVATGGRRPEGFGAGFFYEPTVLTAVDESMEVSRTETFGPIAPISIVDGVEEALARANGVEYGLAGYIFTRDVGRAFDVSERLEVGMVGVNNMVIATPEAPFGGIKQSGFGREGGSEGIGEYSVAKYINLGI